MQLPSKLRRDLSLKLSQIHLLCGQLGYILWAYFSPARSDSSASDGVEYRSTY